MAVTFWSVEMDPNSDLDPVESHLPADLIVQIRKPGEAPTYHRLDTARTPTVRRAATSTRRLRVRRLDV